MVIARKRDLSSSDAVLDRIAKACKMQDISESELCAEADLGRSAISSTRSRGGSLTWPTLKSLVLALQRRRFSRDWILWGEGPPVLPPGPDERLDVGEGASNLRPAPVPQRRK